MIDIKRKNLVLAARGIGLQNGAIPEHQKSEPLEKNELQRIVFKPHEKYGFPTSDIEVMENPKTSPVVREAIRHANRAQTPSNIGCDNDDVVIDTVQGVNESDIDYKDRMNDYVEESKIRLKNQK